MKKTGVARGAIYLFGENLLRFLSSFVFYALIARILNQSQVGEISLLSFVFSLFANLTQFGLPAAATKFAAESVGRGDNQGAIETGRKIARLQTIAAIPSFAFALAITPFLSSAFIATSTPVLALVFAASFSYDFMTIKGSTMLGLRIYGGVALQRSLYIGLSRLTGLILAFTGFGVAGVVIGWLVGGVVAYLHGFFTLMRHKDRGKSESIRYILSYSIPIYIWGFINYFQGWIDITLLYALTTDLPSVGVYFLMTSAAGIVSFTYSGLLGAIFPMLSEELGAKNRESVEFALRASIRMMNSIVIPLGLTLAAVAPTLIQVTYGSDYTIGALPFAILSAGAIIYGHSQLTLTLIQATNRTWLLTMIGVVSTLVDAAVIFLLIGPLGITGAAIARTLLYATSLALSYRAAKGIASFPITEGLARAITAGLAIAIPLAIFDQTFQILRPLDTELRLISETAIFLALSALSLRITKLFGPAEFDLMHLALPTPMHRILRLIQKIIT